MGKVVSVTNQKGGVAKTTTTINLSSGLSLLKKRVLVIDMDSQANTTSGFGIERKDIKYSSYEVLLEKTDIKNAIINIRENIHIIPSRPELIGAEIELIDVEEREKRLKKSIEIIRKNYNVILIDTPPSLGLLTINSLVASDSVLIPLQCEYYALEGVSQLLYTLKLVKKNLNPYLEIEGVLLTMYDLRINLSKQVAEEVKKFFGEKVYKTVIPRNVKLSEAPSFGKTIHEYCSWSKGAISYLELAKEFIQRTNQGNDEF